jgi:hypothetical protein
MSDRRLRDELRDVFDGMTEPAHPALSARIRAHLAEGSSTPARAPRLAAAVAILTALLVVAGLILASRHAAPPANPAATPRPTVSASASPAPGPVVPAPGTTASPPAPTPSATAPSSLPPFVCAEQSGSGPTSPPTGVTDVRVGAQAGYDRFVMQFAGPVPQYDVRAQAGATFTQDASGAPVTLAGSAGLLVTVHGAQAAGSLVSPTDQRPAGTAVVLEARQVGDFEGVVHWGLGLSHATCFRAFTLSGPSRLVVDVQA